MLRFIAAVGAIAVGALLEGCGSESTSSQPNPPRSYDDYCSIDTNLFPKPHEYPINDRINDPLNRLTQQIVDPIALNDNPLAIAEKYGLPGRYTARIVQPSSNERRSVLEQKQWCVSQWSWYVYARAKAVLECRAEVITAGHFILNFNPDPLKVLEAIDLSLERGNNNSNPGLYIHEVCGIMGPKIG